MHVPQVAFSLRKSQLRESHLRHGYSGSALGCAPVISRLTGPASPVYAISGISMDEAKTLQAAFFAPGRAQIECFPFCQYAKSRWVVSAAGQIAPFVDWFWVRSSQNAPYRPELPKPFAARADSSRLATSSTAPVSTGTGIIWAIFSPAFSSTAASPRLVISTRISPR